MWEYLSKQEKMSYLYSTFANQVDDFCENVKMTDCNRELLKYGLNKLKDMPEDHLDTMDPYQRNAHDIIWDAMMEGHAMSGYSKPKKSTTTPIPNSYDDDQSFGDFGEQSAGSARIETVYRVPPPKGFVFKLETGKPLYAYPQYIQNVEKTTYGDKLGFKANQPSQYIEAPLTGPMVVKVYPDGRPVRENDRKIPQDDDLRQYQLSKTKIPIF